MQRQLINGCWYFELGTWTSACVVLQPFDIESLFSW